MADDLALTKPLRWRRSRAIFVNSMGDLFHESVPDAWIDRVFAVMALASQHTFIVLTKRAKRMREYLAARTDNREHAIGAAMREIDNGNPGLPDLPLPNVVLGVSAERQQEVDARIPDLLATPAAVRFASAEPLLGPINLTHIQAPRFVPEDHELEWKFSALDTGEYYQFEDGLGFWEGGDGPHREHRLDWIVCGGESGPGARPMHPDWVRQIRDDCAAAGVPFLLKQWGEWAPDDGSRPISDMLRLDAAYWSGERWIQGPPNLAEFEDGDVAYRLGKRAAGRTLEGVIHDTYPEPRP